MSLITSISGIRGTIGGTSKEGLNPINITQFTAAYGMFIKSNSPLRSGKIVVGRDARLSGEMIKSLVIATLQGLGYDVIDIDLATTPTTEIAVVHEQADGGIIITASHNPKQWNALKLLNHCGEFLNDHEGNKVLELAREETFIFCDVENLGKVTTKSYTQQHIDDVIALPEVDVEAIREADISVAIDCVNSVGGIIIPQLLEALGVSEVYQVNCEPTGHFAHNPEPLPENLTDLSNLVKIKNADVGLSVDPDVDRLAIYCEDGTPFGEENTLVAVADYILTVHQGGNTVSNLSSTRALRDVTHRHGGTYTAAAVGEVNVTTTMKEVNALIGGEGNGGVIYPKAHYGRDALVGIALFLTHMAKSKNKPSQMLANLPKYHMVKSKIELTPDIDIENLLCKVQDTYKNKADISTVDGIKLDFDDRWVHLRKSNTEPIIRIYAEAMTDKEALSLVNEINNIVNKR